MVADCLTKPLQALARVVGARVIGVRVFGNGIGVDRGLSASGVHIEGHSIPQGGEENVRHCHGDDAGYERRQPPPHSGAEQQTQGEREEAQTND